MDYKTIQKQKTLNVMFECPNMQQAVAITDEIDTVCTVQELRWNGQARVATVILDRKASADKIQQVFSEF